MAGIIRPQTEAEKDLTPGIDGNTTGFVSLIGNKATAEAQFKKQLVEKEQEATKKGIPFAAHVARADFNDHYKSEALVSLRKNGFVKPEDIKPIKINWGKYSDLKNFELIDEHERNDENLTNRHKVQVFIKAKKYKFKGFNQTYTIMEDGIVALERALSKK